MSRLRHGSVAAHSSQANLPSGEETPEPTFAQWSEDELKAFFEGLVLYGKQWARIAQRLPGRSEHEVELLYMRSQNALDCLLAQQAELQSAARTSEGAESSSLILPDLSLWFASLRDHDSLLRSQLSQHASSVLLTKRGTKTRGGHSKSDDDSREYSHRSTASSLRRHSLTANCRVNVKSPVETRSKRKPHRKLFGDDLVDTSHTIGTTASATRRSARVRAKSLWNSRDDEQIGAHELLALSWSRDVVASLPKTTETDTSAGSVTESRSRQRATQTLRTPRKRKRLPEDVRADEESSDGNAEGVDDDEENDEETLQIAAEAAEDDTLPEEATAPSETVLRSLPSAAARSKEKRTTAGRSVRVSSSSVRTRATHTTPETRTRLLQRLTRALSQPLLRRWCFCEWFYPNIDAEWYLSNDFQQCLDALGLGQVRQLRKAEWQYVRSLLGRPRRLSAAFLAQERQRLQEHRTLKRLQWRAPSQRVRDDSNGTSVRTELPTEGADVDKEHEREDSEESDKTETIASDSTHREHRPLQLHRAPAERRRPAVPPCFIPLQAVVLAVYPLAPHDIHRGTVVAARADAYEVRFDDSALGTHWVPDVDVMSCGGCEDDNSGVSESRCLGAESQPALTTKRQKLLPMTGEITTASEDNSTTLNRTALYFIANLFRLLERKERLLKELSALNNEAETMTTYPRDFQQQYAWVILKLEETNHELGPALAQMRTLNSSTGSLRTSERAVDSGSGTVATAAALSSTIETSLSNLHSTDTLSSPSSISSHSHPLSAIGISSLVSASPSKNSSTSTNTPLPHYSWYSEVSEQCKSVAQLLVMRVLRNDDAETAVASEEKTSPPTSSPSSTQNQPETHNASISLRLSPRVLHYLTACIALLLHIQTCTEYQMKASEVALAFDAALTSIRPKTQNQRSLRLFKEIEASLTTIRNKLTSQDSS